MLLKSLPANPANVSQARLIYNKSQAGMVFCLF
jgi:hypothetical protein